MDYVTTAGKRPEDTDEPEGATDQEKAQPTQAEEYEEKAGGLPESSPATEDPDEETNQKRFVKKYD